MNLCVIVLKRCIYIHYQRGYITVLLTGLQANVKVNRFASELVSPKQYIHYNQLKYYIFI